MSYRWPLWEKFGRLALAVSILIAVAAQMADAVQSAATRQPTHEPRTGTSSSPSSGASIAAKAATVRTEDRETLDFLEQVVAWYRQSVIEERLAIDPTEVLFLRSDRRAGLEAVHLGFQYARARAALNNADAASLSMLASVQVSGKATSSTGGAAKRASLKAGQQKAIEELQNLQSQANDLKVKIAQMPRPKAVILARHLEILEIQIKLSQSRVESYKAMVEFEDSATAGANEVTGLPARIDELERSLPELTTEPANPDTTLPAVARNPGDLTSSPDGGLFYAVETLLRLGREGISIEDRIAETQAILALYAKIRAPLINQIRALNQHASELAAQDGASDVDANRRLKQEFEELIRRHKLIVDALIPLAKMNVVLQLYVENLNRWNTDVDQRSASQLRRVFVRFGALGVLLIAIFVAALLWRTLTLRYVQDLRRRRQLLQMRKFALVSVISLVLVFEFTDELSTLATVLGLAAAGVAVALQNVILSFAGYFFVTGRYGIRVGDRIQLAGVNGDVIEIGLFKLALMELAGDGDTHQPTGRVVVFPNSIIFQSNGNFFRQTPGTNFAWNEFKLTMAPACDFRLAEKRLIEVVEEVCSRYSDIVQRQYQELEHSLNIKLEAPRPQSRIRLGQNGIEMTIRYPADARRAVQVGDEISRRVLDAIAREPALTLAVPGTPNLIPVPASLSIEHSAEVDGVNDHRIVVAATAAHLEASPNGFESDGFTRSGSEGDL